MKITKATITRKTAAVEKAEGTVKKVLGELSRDLLAYVPETGDIPAVNRLIGVLTMKNREVAILFFKHMMDYVWDEERNEFSKKNPKRAEECKVRREEFLADEANNIWSWTKHNVKEAEVKPTNYVGRIAKDVKKALASGNTPSEVVQAVLAGGLDAHAVLAFLQAVAVQEEKKAA